jgi:hypothetical protein
LADLLGEKNTVPTEKNKLKSTDYKPDEHGLYVVYISNDLYDMFGIATNPNPNRTLRY